MLSWIYIGVLSGSIVTGGFDSEEHCEGHRVMLERQKVAGKCVQAPGSYLTGSVPIWQGNNLVLTPGSAQAN